MMNLSTPIKDIKDGTMPPNNNDLIDINVDVSSLNNRTNNHRRDGYAATVAAAPPFHPMQMAQRHLQPLRMNALQSNFIRDRMVELKEREAKRRKIGGNWNEVRHRQQEHRQEQEEQSQHRHQQEEEEHQQEETFDDDFYDYDFDDDDDDDDDEHEHGHGHDNEDSSPTPRDLAAEYGSDSVSSGVDFRIGDDDEFDIWNELERHPDDVQIVATSGGLITDWNEEFVELTKPSASLEKIPMTIFELVDSKSLPSLYGMLALSLHGTRAVDVVDFAANRRPSGRDRNDGDGDCDCDGTTANSDVVADDGDGARSEADGGTPRTSSSSVPSHLSITLPCILFRNSTTRYDITIVYMNDIPSMRRCFIGIITRSHGGVDDDDIGLDGSGTVSSEEIPASSSSSPLPLPRHLPCGRILRVNDELLCRMLLGPSVR